MRHHQMRSASVECHRHCGQIQYQPHLEGLEHLPATSLFKQSLSHHSLKPRHTQDLSPLEHTQKGARHGNESTTAALIRKMTSRGASLSSCFQPLLISDCVTWSAPMMAKETRSEMARASSPEVDAETERDCPLLGRARGKRGRFFITSDIEIEIHFPC